MSDILNNILEKFKKVDGGPLDPKRSGADGHEDEFIGKHIDNIETTDGPGQKEVDASNAKTKLSKRKPHKGYNPKEDEEVYESSDEGYDIEKFYDMEEDLDIDIDMDVLKEDAVFFMNIIDEAVAEFIEEEADEEEKEMLEELMSSDEGYMELIEALFEEKECGECGKEMSKCDCDDDDHDEDDDDVIDSSPKLKGQKKQDAAEGYGKKKMKEADGEEADPITKHADVKMVKTKSPDGKVIYRKQKSDIKVS
ncbi:hypothetical protein OAF54_02205 [bacterium]|nr:hypothetical protein [bacterium]